MLYLNTDMEDNIIVNEIIPIFCDKYHCNVVELYNSDTVELYDFVTKDQITEIVNLYIDNDGITLDEIEEIAPNFRKLIDILNKTDYSEIEYTYVIIDNFLRGESPSFYFLDQWAGLTPEQIIERICSRWGYESLCDVVFKR